jgi:hypothetical protein
MTAVSLQSTRPPELNRRIPIQTTSRIFPIGMTRIAGLFFLGLTWITAASQSVCAEELKARTRDGREVVLKEDGTWEFVTKPAAADPTAAPEDAPKITKPEKAVETYKGKLGTLTLWLEPRKWKKLAKSGNESAEVQFQAIGNDVAAIIIHEDIEFGLDELADIAIENMEGGLKDVELLLRERRIVNGQEMIALRAVGHLGKSEMIFCGYYASGPFGSVQVFLIVQQKHFEKLEQQIEDFLAGIVITPKPAEPE